MFKKIAVFFLMLSVIATSMPTAFFIKIYADTITVAYINGDNVHVRSTPSTADNNNIIEKISYTTVTVLEQSDDWLKISYVKDGETRQGYIYYDSSYITINTYNPDASFEEKIKAFPESYRDALRSLHSQYPNWEFIPDPVSTSFSDAVAQQMTNMRKQVQISYQPISWRSMGLGSYDWNDGEWSSTNGGWTGASREIIAYYMDPRNFLNSSEIYMFLEQSYNSSVQNEAGVKKIISGTFLEKSYTPASGEPGDGSYLNVIMLAAKESGVSPYVIASKIIQEQGSSGSSSLISGTYSGYEGYYNFFNVSASGSTNAEVIKNGLEKAKASGWNTRYKSILGGAQFLALNYIAKCQDTYYYQDFNVHNNGTHQFAQAVHDACNKGKSLSSTYQSDNDFALSFRIPVFADMPDSACEKPASSDKKNNYYFLDISAVGLTPSFSIYTYEYNLSIVGDTTISITVPEGATYISDKSFQLIDGNNVIYLKVKSETEYINSYIINIYSATNCTLNITELCTVHDFTVKSNDFLKSEANCKSPAIYYFACSKCGACGTETYEYGSVSDHSFGEWQLRTVPTCTSKGEIFRLCTFCDAEETQTISTSEHDFTNNICDNCGCEIIYFSDSDFTNPPFELNGEYIYDLYNISRSRATEMRVTFDENLDFGENSTYIYIYDELHNLIGRYTDIMLAGNEIRVSGNTVKFRVISQNDDISFNAEIIAIYPDCKHGTATWVTEIEPTFTSNGYSKYLCDDCGELLEEKTISKLLLGDTDRDCIVNSKDLVVFRKMLLNSINCDKYQITNADINTDSKVDLRDLVRIKKILAEIYY